MPKGSVCVSALCLVWVGLARTGAARERGKEGKEGRRRWIGGEGTKFWFDSDAGKRKRGIWMSIKEGGKTSLVVVWW